MSSRPRVGLFVTCLVDLMRPRIGVAAVKLLEQAGCDVEVPRAQTCCGQPAWNSGDDRNAAAIVRCCRSCAAGSPCVTCRRRKARRFVIYGGRGYERARRHSLHHPRATQARRSASAAGSHLSSHILSLSILPIARVQRQRK